LAILSILGGAIGFQWLNGLETEERSASAAVTSNACLFGFDNTLGALAYDSSNNKAFNYQNGNWAENTTNFGANFSNIPGNSKLFGYRDGTGAYAFDATDGKVWLYWNGNWVEDSTNFSATFADLPGNAKLYGFDGNSAPYAFDQTDGKHYYYSSFTWSLASANNVDVNFAARPENAELFGIKAGTGSYSYDKFTGKTYQYQNPNWIEDASFGTSFSNNTQLQICSTANNTPGSYMSGYIEMRLGQEVGGFVEIKDAEHDGTTGTLTNPYCDFEVSGIFSDNGKAWSPNPGQIVPSNCSKNGADLGTLTIDGGNLASQTIENIEPI